MNTYVHISKAKNQIDGPCSSWTELVIYNKSNLNKMVEIKTNNYFIWQSILIMNCYLQILFYKYILILKLL